MSKPSSDLVGDPDNWDASQRRQWLKMLGGALENSYTEDPGFDLDKAIYQLAASIRPKDSTSEFDDDLWSITREVFYDQPAIVWFQFTGGFGMYAGISLIDLGSEKQFVYELPIEDLGTDWILHGVVDRGDTDGLIEAANDLLERAWVPNEISISDPITRDDVFKAYTRGHNAMRMWDNLATIMSKWGHDYPIETDGEKADLLNAYLDIALQDE